MLFLKKRNIKSIAAIGGCVILLCVFVHFFGANPLSKAVKSVFVPFMNGVSYISYRIDSIRDFLWEADAYRRQNEELNARINELESKNRDNEQLQSEIEKLHSILELKENMSDYTSLAAKVVAYSSNDTFSTVEINKGALNGVSVGNCVVTDRGVVGTVTEVGPNWATVSSILNPDSAIGIRASRTDAIGVVEGDALLSKQGLCKLSFLDRNSNIIVGDLLETSGAGGVYPSGLILGKITEINSDNTGNLDYATVEPIVDFSRLYAVLVINGMEE